MFARVLTALALAVLASPSIAEDDAPVRDAVAARIAQGADELATSLASLGSAAIPPLFDALAAGAVSAPNGSRAELDATAREAVLSALAAMPAAELRAHLSNEASGADEAADAERDDASAAAALAVLGRVGAAADMDLCVRFAEPSDPDEAITRARRVAFESAITEIAARDEGAARALHDVFRSLRPELLAPAARCMAAGDPERGLSLLAGLLDVVPTMDGFLLAEIARLAADAPRPVDAQVLTAVRMGLGSRDSNEVILAARALGVLDDFAAFPRLIELVEHDDPRMSAAADEALEEMSGRVFRRNARAWEAWYAEESLWWRRAASSLGAVDDPDPTVALAALREISGHRLNRHRLAEAVVVAVRRSEREVVLVACSILRSLDSTASVPVLAQAIERREPELRAAIHDVLRSITGLDHPADDPAWQALGRRETSSGRR